MTTLDSTAAGVLEEIRRARREGRSLPPHEDGIDLEAAYRIQAALGDGRQLKGYKVVSFDSDTPVYGRVYFDMLVERVALGTFLRPRLAMRLALVLANELPATPTPGLCDLGIGVLFPALEITDSVWDDEERTIVDEVADNASAGAIALGEVPLRQPLTGTAILAVDGSAVATVALEAYGDVAARVAWLASCRGGLPAGTVVVLGPSAPEEPIAAPAGTLELFCPDGPVLTVVVDP